MDKQRMLATDAEHVQALVKDARTKLRSVAEIVAELRKLGVEAIVTNQLTLDVTAKL